MLIFFSSSSTRVLSYEKNEYLCDMKLLKSILPALAFLIVAVSCDIDADPKSHFDTYGDSIGYQGGTRQFTFYTNGSWTAQSPMEGVVITPDSGYGDAEITVKIPANDSIKTCSARIVFVTTIGSDTYNNRYVITVAAKPFVKCDNLAQNISADGGKVWFDVNSNYPWKLSSCTCDGVAWAGSVSPDNWGKNPVKVEVTVPANTTFSPKVYTITLALIDYPEVTVDLRVIQLSR